MTAGMRSGLYTGRVRHRRFSPVENAFEYGVFYLLVDLDELPRLDRELRGFSYNRPGLTSLHDRDHLGSGAGGIRDKLERWLRDRGESARGGRVLLLTYPRVLGYVFNPVSYFFCLEESGGLRFTVAEVNNTFGETYCYLLNDGEPMGGEAVRSRRDKVFHVSPFMRIEDIRYDWILTPPRDRLTVHIDEFEAGEKFFDATLSLKRQPLTTATLWKALFRYPLMTLRTIALIHWQAVRLWARRAPFFRKPAPPDNGLEVA